MTEASAETVGGTRRDWTNGKAFTVLDEHMTQPWNGYRDGRTFRCHMCGDFFKPGDVARLVWCNGVKEARESGVHCGNVMVGACCDAPNIYGRLAEHERIGKERYWSLVDPQISAAESAQSERESTTMSNRFRRTREQCGLSLGQAAKLLHVDRDWLDSTEHGWTPADEHIADMARIYGCSIAWLRGETSTLSAENEALLLTCEHTGDRAVVREFMEMIATRDPGAPPAPTAAERIAKAAAKHVAWDRPASTSSKQEEADRQADAEQPVSRKRRYVTRQRQTRDHHCHWPGCTAQVPPAMWGCRVHWFKLPKALRDRIWRAYVPGQEVDMTPSAEYLQVADDVQQWIRENVTRVAR